MRTFVTALFALLALLASATLAPVAAEPLVETRHFRFHQVDGTEQNTRRLAETAEARFDVLCTTLRVCDIAGAAPIDVWLASDAEDFASAFPEGAPMAEWAVGVAFVRHGRIVLRAHGSALFTLPETFDHELSHVLLHRGAAPGHVPRWFSEGVAIWQAGESVLERLVSAQRAALTDSLVPLSELSGRFPQRGPAVALAYAEAALFVRWTVGRAGPEAVPRLVRALREGAGFEAAYREVTGLSLAEAEDAWADTVESDALMLTLLTDQNVVWSLLTLLFLYAAWVRIREKRERLAEMALAEAAARDAAAALLR
ncbi:MAG: peptidase MA family metallohydrolase, partial [Myxococcota bacterium]|nr:peptidase MA family metallohydrolase [Myxococcota bacterium]